MRRNVSNIHPHLKQSTIINSPRLLLPLNPNQQTRNLPIPPKQHLRPLVHDLTRNARVLDESSTVHSRRRAEFKQAILQLLLTRLQLADLRAESTDGRAVVFKQRVRILQRVGQRSRRRRRWQQRRGSATGRSRSRSLGRSRLQRNAVLRLPGLGVSAKSEDVLVEVSVIDVGFLDFADEESDVCFELGGALPGAADDVFEFLDVAAGFAAVVQGMLFRDVELLLEGEDGGGRVARVGGNYVWGGITGDIVVGVGGVVDGRCLGSGGNGFRLLKTRLALDAFGAELEFTLFRRLRFLRRSGSGSIKGHGELCC